MGAWHSRQSAGAVAPTAVTVAEKAGDYPSANNGKVDEAIAGLMIVQRAAALGALLALPKGRDSFVAFLESEFSGNNLQFFDAVDSLLREGRLCDPTDAAHIVDKYVRPGAALEVSLPSHLQRGLQAVQSLPPPKPAPSSSNKDLISCDTIDMRTESQKGRTTPLALTVLLEQARDEVLRLMAFDAMPRYLRSHAYKALAKDLEDTTDSDLHFLCAVAQAGAARTQTEGAASLASNWLVRFRCLAAILPCNITIADMTLPQFPLVYVNEAFIKTTGFNFEESTGRNCAFLQGPRTEPAALESIRNALRNGEEARIALTNYRRDGTEFRNLLALVPVFDDSETGAEAMHHPRFFLGIQYDVTAEGTESARMVALSSIIGALPRHIRPTVSHAASARATLAQTGNA